MRTKILSSVFSIILVTLPVFADNEKNYVVGNDMHVSNKVSFTSSATLVSFTGTTGEITGNASVNFEDLTKSSGEIKVNLNSLDTGIEKRNAHMRDVLNSKNKPLAVFKLNEIKTSLKNLPPSKPIFVNSMGELTINGITKKLRSVLELTYLPETDKGFRSGNWIMLKTDFDIKLEDFNIEPPGIVPMKVNNIVNVNITVMGKQE